MKCADGQSLRNSPKSNGDATTFFNPGDRCCVGAAGGLEPNLTAWQPGTEAELPAGGKF
jgi:hypothetical protein